MPKRKRSVKEPITGRPLKSRKLARRLTTDFHILNYELEKLDEEQGERAPSEVEAARSELEARIEAMGGRRAYQNASILLTSLHRPTSKWVMSVLSECGMRPVAPAPRLRVLEIGAINTQLVECGWMDTRAIDFLSRHRRIEQMDFFNLQPTGDFGAVVCSMVLNCVPEARRRGDMLLRCRECLTDCGVLFVMIPLLCVTASPLLTDALLLAMFEALGFVLLRKKFTNKIAFYCVQREASKPTLGAAELATRFPDPPPVIARRAGTNKFGISWAHAL